MRKEHRVGLVVDRHFGAQINPIARVFHVWVVESPDNTPVIYEIWRSNENDTSRDPLESGVTSFQAGERDSPEDMCLEIIHTIDEHHGEYSHDPPWIEIEVFGVKLTEVIRSAFDAIGGNSYMETDSGFICKRGID